MPLTIFFPSLLALILAIYIYISFTPTLPTIRSLTFTLNENLLRRAPNCHPTNGTINELWNETHRVPDVWKYAYHTYRIPGRYCGIPFTQSEMIGKAVEDYILKEAEKYEGCDTQCLRFDKGGNWDGWIALGKEGRFDGRVGCGPGVDKEGRCGREGGV
ncbi:hypothetical protein BO94DRAFT_578551 [Aspergillus sclerotioniger CBS 115572]|uniref:Secreted protein CSS2 C-terminal domain-containing protein n=1 Tax=Aspergillus sclerotioniger CBS 115572 TaxID=1450535 RepID=A0A317VG97_9EURO|nr:hypothetical protein BO94DRAFT_578551 [Aspergillus sclerotioniger CBS 115572]PWY72157.1 hypothetical protein BO94DRAFT_578551 [Aspergillus sclerotioniger CBS 115572]